jgi:hypothetical protein
MNFTRLSSMKAAHGRCFVPRIGNPGIALVFREMWDSTALSL